MSSNLTEQKRQTTMLEIKAGSVTLPIVKLFNADLDFIIPDLREKLKKAPEFFRNAPVIVDIGELKSPHVNIDFSRLIDGLKSLDLIPVGIRGGHHTQQEAARQARLAILSEIKLEPKSESVLTQTANKTTTTRPNPEPETSSKPANTTKVIHQPVRSGQRVYAVGGDLIVLAQVSPGAEIMADGNIHIYAPLKGRALAGVKGNTEARIFCSDLQAELVAIGGQYRVSENLDNSIRGKQVQIYLKEDSLIVESLQNS